MAEFDRATDHLKDALNSHRDNGFDGWHSETLYLVALLEHRRDGQASGEALSRARRAARRSVPPRFSAASTPCESRIGVRELVEKPVDEFSQHTSFPPPPPRPVIGTGRGVPAVGRLVANAVSSTLLFSPAARCHSHVRRW
ncbi:MAG: hypothetical protein PGN29_12745 [Gordonia paraffinivorans]